MPMYRYRCPTCATEVHVMSPRCEVAHNCRGGKRRVMRAMVLMPSTRNKAKPVRA